MFWKLSRLIAVLCAGVLLSACGSGGDASCSSDTNLVQRLNLSWYDSCNGGWQLQDGVFVVEPKDASLPPDSTPADLKQFECGAVFHGRLPQGGFANMDVSSVNCDPFVTRARLEANGFDGPFVFVTAGVATCAADRTKMKLGTSGRNTQYVDDGVDFSQVEATERFDVSSVAHFYDSKKKSASTRTQSHQFGQGKFG